MRKLFVLILLMVSLPAAALAQSQSERRAWGYGFVGIGGNTGSNSSPRFTAGGGGEALFYRGLLIGLGKAGFHDPVCAGFCLCAPLLL